MYDIISFDNAFGSFAELLNFFGGRMDDGTDGDTCHNSTVIS
jgi:hypothetical protein